MKGSMDWVQRGGPWTGSKEVVHGPGPQGWSMDLVSMFCIRPYFVDNKFYNFQGVKSFYFVYKWDGGLK